MTKAQREKVINFHRTHEWSYQLIADRFGLTRNQVAGIMFRHRHPYSTRVNKSGQKAGRGRNKIGTGHSGPGMQPVFTAQNSRDVGRAS